jgi:hypothetical protein
MQRIQLFVIVIVLTLVGCSDAARVTGTVKLKDGTPLPGGAITFEDERMNVYSPVDSKGNFSLYQIKPGDGVPPGTYKGRISFSLDALDPGNVAHREAAIAQKVPFPMKYLSFDHSELTLTVEPRKPVHLDIVLE